MNKRLVNATRMAIAIAILAGLVAIMLNHRNSVKRSLRLDAQSDLQRLATLQEAFHAFNATYTADLDDLGLEPEQFSGRYDIAIARADEDYFEATATLRPEAARVVDRECRVYGYNSEGERSSSPGDVSTCW